MKEIKLNDILHFSEDEIYNVKIKFNVFNGWVSPFDEYKNNPDIVDNDWFLYKKEKYYFHEGEIGINCIPLGDDAWINGGFFVLEPEVFNYINPSDNTVFEKEPLETLAKDGQLNAYRHDGFWCAMDTLRDKNILTDMWNSDTAPWALWKKGENKDVVTC